MVSVIGLFELVDPALVAARGNEPFPLFMTSARRELIDSAVFLDFFAAAGAIVALSLVWCRGVVEGAQISL